MTDTDQTPQRPDPAQSPMTHPPIIVRINALRNLHGLTLIVQAFRKGGTKEENTTTHYTIIGTVVPESDAPFLTFCQNLPSLKDVIDSLDHLTDNLTNAEREMFESQM